MSLIIAVKHDDRVVMMADSYSSGGSYRTILNPESNAKIVIMNDDVLVGGAGRAFSIDTVTSHPEWFDTKGAPLDAKFLITSVVPKMYEELSKNRLLKEEKEGAPAPSVEARFIVAQNDRIFKISRDFSVREMDTVAFIGCTSEFAFTWLEDDISEDNMLRVLRLSAKHNSGVGAPFVRVDTVNKKIEVVEE